MIKIIIGSSLMGLAFACGAPPSHLAIPTPLNSGVIPYVGKDASGSQTKGDETPLKSDSIASPPKSGPIVAPLTSDPAVSMPAEPLVTVDPAIQGIPLAMSLTSFAENVYKPFLAKDCSSCHAETFAPMPTIKESLDESGAKTSEIVVPASLEKAHTSFLKLVNFNSFSGIELVQPVVKMTAGHNCSRASDKECARILTDAIGIWLADLAKAGYAPVPAKFLNTTTEVAMAKASPYVLATNPTMEVAANMDQATLSLPWKIASDDVDGAIQSYAFTDEMVVADNVANVNKALTLTLGTQSTGGYNLWLRVKAKTAKNTRLGVQVNGGRAINLTVPVTNEEWKWVQLHQVINGIDAPTLINVASAGTQTIKLLFMDPGIRVNLAVLTKRIDDFDGDLFSKQFYQIRIPLQVPGVAQAAIVAIIWDITTAAERKSIGVRKLLIQSDSPLAIRGIRPLINSTYSVNQGTYRDVDTVAGGIDPTEQTIETGGSTASIWLTDRSKDRLSFSFEAIGKAP